MRRTPVLAAGGIVLRANEPQLIAVVRLRKRNEWVLPKGKLDDGETPREAALREVLEETGHDVTVHEFVGTLAYETGGRSKVVQFWRMQADGDQVHALMSDVREVDWLPLDAAVERLSRAYERAFLANVGPHALAAAQRGQRRPRKAKPPARKRAGRPVVMPPPSLAGPVSVSPQAEVPPAAPDAAEPVACEAVATEPPGDPHEPMPKAAPEEPPLAVEAPQVGGACNVDPVAMRRKSLAEKLRDWLRRAA